MITSRHSPGLVPRKWALVRPWKRFMAGTATIVTLLFLTVVLACARMEGMHVGPAGVEEIALSTIASKTPVPDTDEELCKLLHDQMLALQVSSTGSIVLGEISHLETLIGEDISPQTPIFDACRPPGNRSATAQLISFQLYSVLRI